MQLPWGGTFAQFNQSYCHGQRPNLPLSATVRMQVVGVRLERALSEPQLTYLKSGLTALAGRYFLLAEHGVPLPLHKDGGVSLSYATEGLPRLLRRMRPHDSQRRLPADNEAAVEYLDQWLKDWPETDSGRRWAHSKETRNSA